jgi:phenylpropionate dioxygenase-like ring-hydroxylating dioxygenase large terminal subunit
MHTLFAIADGAKIEGTRSAIEDRYANEGFRGRWYPLTASRNVIGTTPLALDRMGERIVLWRDTAGTIHAQEDRCPHRGARLSQGFVNESNIVCPYHGISIDGDGRIAQVPALPGCPIEGRLAVRTYAVEEIAGAIFAYFPTPANEEPIPLGPPPEFTDPAWSHKLQKDVAFDWTEYGETGGLWMKLDIPYPVKNGPGGPFRVIGFATPIDERTCEIFFWRLRKVDGWQRDLWRFLYRERLEKRHYDVLEQDRTVLEGMADDARDHEILYQHDIGITRLRRRWKAIAREQIEAAQALAASRSQRIAAEA